MYLYQQGRKPSRQFHYDIMMFGPDVHREGLQPGASSDECFHSRLAVDLLGLITCNASVPAVNATVIIVANRTSEGPLVKNAGATDAKGVFQEAVVFDDEALRINGIQDVLLMFTNVCDNAVGPIINTVHLRRVKKSGRDSRQRWCGHPPCRSDAVSAVVKRTLPCRAYRHHGFYAKTTTRKTARRPSLVHVADPITCGGERGSTSQHTTPRRGRGPKIY